MRLNLTTDYALRSLLYLAARPGRARVAEIAEFFRISRHHAAKAAQQLARHGFVRSVRGAGGGLELARGPHEIDVGEVVLALEGNLHLLDCVGVAGVCVIQPGCRLRGALAEAERRMLDYLRGVRLSDLLPAGRTLDSWKQAPAAARRRPAGARR